ncbi:MAG TPA: T9SS type A sorting domain-containing protein, partial [Flavisolibacter sp.]|nr:T9SS type A sorting domain-containing protein [Flavisolibacter sp.]
NGRYFYSLGAREKIGSTTSGLKYQFPDKNLSSAPVYYYRAKTMDDVGVIKYSKVVRIAGRMDKGGFLLSPNPASDYFHLNLAAAWQSTVRSYIIYDSGGAVVAKEKISNAGSQLRVSVRHLPAGSYRIELTDNGGKQLVRSFIVSR